MQKPDLDGPNPDREPEESFYALFTKCPLCHAPVGETCKPVNAGDYLHTCQPQFSHRSRIVRAWEKSHEPKAPEAR